MKAFLQSQTDPTRRYELKVLSATNTAIEVRFAGGKVGKYDLEIVRQGWG